MTRPTTFLVRILVFLALVGAAAALLGEPLLVAFQGNPLLNALILAVLALGIGWNIHQVTRLSPEVTWLETYQRARARLAAIRSPKLLAPMASMLASRDGGERRLTLSAPTMRSLLDGIGARLDESRELSRYMTGLLIFLGLLGTFWGLLQTVRSIADVIGGMTPGTGDVAAMFGQLKIGLARPLGGMSTAFSASLFGLAGSLVLGFLDLTAGQAQNRFYNELEEWLAGLTRLSSGVLADGEESVPAYLRALVEQTAESLDALQRTLGRGEEGRALASHAVAALADRIAELGEATRAGHQLMQRLAEPGADDSARTLRGIESLLSRLLNETELGRAQSAAELRNDLRVLTRTVAAALADESRG